MACQDNEVNDAITKRRISGLTQTSCHLDWSLKEEVDNNGNVVFIVAGVDQSGMINIISGSILDTQMEMTPAMTSKFVKMTVLAVNSIGLLDMKEMDIEPQDACENLSVEVEETTLKTGNLPAKVEETTLKTGNIPAEVEEEAFETIQEIDSIDVKLQETDEVVVQKLTDISLNVQIALFITLILILTLLVSIISYFFFKGNVREKKSEGDRFEEDLFLDSKCWIV